MSIFSDNLRYLRVKSGMTQQKIADELKIPRERYAKYEGTTDPPLDCLQRISRYFHVSIDLLLSFDIRRVPYENLLQLEENRILLPITVDSDGENKIEIVTAKARAGYLTGYGDPEFVENLQRISLPFLSNGKYRAFPIEGDSMPPHNDKSFIVGKYLEKLADIKDGKTYVVLSRNDGIVYKRLFRKPKRETIFLFHSDNNIYKPYEVKANEILEIWEHVCSFCTQEFQPDDLGVMNVKDMFQQLRLEISELKKG
ncbi:XRE family transcriptional regulator [Flavobacterium nackdongense]|uniref:Helix-turn-helix domain-containing protein n=1 Tax=Flavobacterium nackdongense TaxID=2547394 RepID=A0A4V1AGX8_9FLAO|nr:helix-turn-helix domain-containing protein [Flavobacterium nackdongense]QBN19592.1 helix-turn-helix domain-containing protein [Flavobacterium nackdongense]